MYYRRSSSHLIFTVFTVVFLLFMSSSSLYNNNNNNNGIIMVEAKVPTGIMNLRRVVDAILKQNQTEHFALMRKYTIKVSELDQCSDEVANVTILQKEYLPDISSVLVNNKIIACKDGDGTKPWMTSETTGFYVDLMDLIRDEMRILYDNPALEYEYVTVDTSLGWFDVLKAAVDKGECSILISTANTTPEREKQVMYGCAFSGVRDAFLRGELEPNRPLISTDELNLPTVKMCVQKGTSYAELVAQDYYNAQVTIVDSQSDCYGYLIRREVHLTFCDRFCLKAWLDVNRDKCTGCTIFPYGDPTQFAPMYTLGNSATTTRLAFTLLATVATMWFAFIL